MAKKFEITVKVPNLGTVKHVVVATTRQEAMNRVLAAHPTAEHISKIETRKPE